MNKNINSVTVSPGSEYDDRAVTDSNGRLIGVLIGTTLPRDLGPGIQSWSRPAAAVVPATVHKYRRGQWTWEYNLDAILHADVVTLPGFRHSRSQRDHADLYASIERNETEADARRIRPAFAR